MPTLIFGHRNPDTDSVTSAIALSYLKNRKGEDTVPCVLGSLNKESKFVLERFQVSEPTPLQSVKIQLKDLNYDKVKGISPHASMLEAYRLIEENNLKTLPIVNERNHLIGIVTMKDIAMGLIQGDFYELDTTIENIIKDLKGKVLVDTKKDIQGRISVIAFYSDSIIGKMQRDNIIILGDRYAIIEDAIKTKVKLIIITGGKELPKQYIDMAEEYGVPVISVEMDTYTTSKLINQCNYVSKIMRHKDIIQFQEDEYLEEVKEEMINSNFRNYPVVNKDHEFLGFVNKKDIFHPQRKKVILVDHNEYGQSADGLHEAEILEIVDHHKIGDIATSMPIHFRNMPVGSTCTIVYRMMKEFEMDIPQQIAGLLLSGIISDTLFLKSPTTTEYDEKAVHALNNILQLDLEQYAMELFKAGTSLEGYTIEEIFYRDFKAFRLEDSEVGIAQVFTLDIEDVFNRKDQFMEFIHQTHRRQGYYLTMLIITDILKNGSYLLYQCENPTLISFAFGIKPEEGVFVDALVSRKKQVVPKLSEALRMLQ
ncbi:MAG: putative manganese-dependent inorganic diphosphatase [Bacillota bacterium]